MKQIDILYTCNIKLNVSKFEEQVPLLNNALTIIYDTLDTLQIKGIFFLDTEMMLKIEQKFPDHYNKIKHTLINISKSGHNIELLINPDWEKVWDLHTLNQERIYDIFAQGKYILQQLYSKSSVQEKPLAVRVLSGKIQPFAYFRDIYKMIGIKVDISIIPKIKYSLYFDYRNIKQGEVIRFSKDPNSIDRFGEFTGISRGLFKPSLFMRLSIKNRIKAHKKKFPTDLLSILDNSKIEPKLISIRVLENKKLKILSPDVVTLTNFKTIIEIQHAVVKHVCVLESMIENITGLTKINLAWLKTRTATFKFVSLDDIIKKYSTTYNIHFK